MSRREKDDLEVFPQVVGGADTWRQRTMLDAVGGVDTIRTRVITNGDGSETLLVTRAGMAPFFRTTPAQETAPPEEPELVYGSDFFAVPSSATHLDGYTPSGAPGPLCQWENWHSKSGPPAAHGGPDTGNGILTAYSPVGTGFENVIGSVTWYSDKIKFGGTRVMLSWRGGSLRGGRYGVFVNGNLNETDVATYNCAPSNNTEVVYGCDATIKDGAGTTDFSPYLWIGGPDIKVTLNVPVMSAAIKTDGVGGYILVVLYTSATYTCPIDLFAVVGGRTVINPDLNGAELTLTLANINAGTFTFRMFQAPFINSSGTKAISVGRQIQENSYHFGAFEIDLFGNEVSFLVQDVQGTEDAIGSYSSSGGVTDKAMAGGASITRRVLAADYKGDKPVFVSVTRGFSFLIGGHAEAPPPSGGVYSKSVTEWNSSPFKGLLVEHSELGILKKIGVSIEHRQVFTGSIYYSSPPGGSQYYSVSSTSDSVITNVNYDMVDINLLNADLRHDTFVFGYRIEHGKLVYSGADSGTFSKVDGAVTSAYSSSITTTTENDGDYFECVVFVGGREVWSDRKYLYPSGTVGPDTTNSSGSWTSISAAQNSTLSGSVGNEIFTIESFYGPSPGSLLPVNSYNQTWSAVVPYPPTYCHVAVSDDGKAAYVDVSARPHEVGFRTDTYRVQGTMFVINGQVHPLGENTYAPGSHATLCCPIFFPKRVIG